MRLGARSAEAASGPPTRAAIGHRGRAVERRKLSRACLRARLSAGLSLGRAVSPKPLVGSPRPPQGRPPLSPPAAPPPPLGSAASPAPQPSDPASRPRSHRGAPSPNRPASGRASQRTRQRPRRASGSQSLDMPARTIYVTSHAHALLAFEDRIEPPRRAAKPAVAPHRAALGRVSPFRPRPPAPSPEPASSPSSDRAIEQRAVEPRGRWQGA
jgi:hypothetical protein